MPKRKQPVNAKSADRAQYVEDDTDQSLTIDGGEMASDPALS